MTAPSTPPFLDAVQLLHDTKNEVTRLLEMGRSERCLTPELARGMYQLTSTLYNAVSDLAAGDVQALHRSEDQLLVGLLEDFAFTDLGDELHIVDENDDDNGEKTLCDRRSKMLYAPIPEGTLCARCCRALVARMFDKFRDAKANLAKEKETTQ